MNDFDFRTCPNCAGYGVRDSGANCRTCGGSGTGGLRSTNGCIGSGEIIIDTATGRIVPPSEFRKLMLEKHGAPNPDA